MAQLRRYPYRIGFYPVSTVSDLINLKNTQEKSGLYCVGRGQSLSFYIGQTGRKLKIRLGEHQKTSHSDIFHESAVPAHFKHTGDDIQQTATTFSKSQRYSTTVLKVTYRRESKKLKRFPPKPMQTLIVKQGQCHVCESFYLSQL